MYISFFNFYLNNNSIFQLKNLFNFMIFFYLNIFINSICVPGLIAHFWYPNKIEFIKNSSEIIYSNSYSDFGFKGSFCPLINGFYRIIIEGTYHEQCENDYSWYNFYNYSGKNRTSPFLHLNSKSCYQFIIWASTCQSNSYGMFYIQKQNENKRFLFQNESFTCYKTFCKNNAIFPYCLINSKNLKFSFFKKILFLNFIVFIK